MAYQLTQLEKPSPSDKYYDPGFLRVLEDHMEFLRTVEGTMFINIEPVKLMRYQFDMRRLMEDAGITADLHWIVMRMNNITSMQRTPKNLQGLLVPDKTRISRLLQSYLSQNKIN